MGSPNGREDHPADGDGASPRGPGRVPRRLRRSTDHRPGRAVPGPARRRADLRQPGAVVGSCAAGVLPLRSVGSGWRVHPGVLRRGVHGRGERLDVPGLTEDGRRGHRRTRDARGDGRCADARDRQRLWRQPRHRRQRGDRSGAEMALVPADELARRATVGARGRPQRGSARRSPRSFRRRSDARTTSTRSSTHWSTKTRSSRSSRCSPRSSICGFGRLDGDAVGIVANNPMHLGGVLFVDSADKAARFVWLCDAFNIPLRVPRRRAGLHDRHQRRAPRHHSPRSQDDHRDRRGDRPEDLGDRPEGVRRGALRDVWPGVRTRRVPRAAQRRRSP